MGNANTHERRKSGVPETGLTIENIREKPRIEEAATLSTATETVIADKKTEKTPPPSFETAQTGTVGDNAAANLLDDASEFRPRAETIETGDTVRMIKKGSQLSQGKGLPTIFKYSGDKAKEVYVCGTFSNWEKIPMVRTQKDFFALVDLPVGDHQFKYYVDNEWANDKNLPLMENDQGSQNNVITIQQEDFEAFAALDMDSAATNIRHQRGNEAEFGQDIPGISSFENRPGPPILPPHLLQVILNKDTPLSCEPTLLPEPNHVMINHLYAMSIKDGVMVISSTQRFRKKYVTTILYKPIEP